MATALSLPSMTLLSTQMATVNVHTLKITTLTLCTGYTDSALLGDGQLSLALADANARACSGAWDPRSLSPAARNPQAILPPLTPKDNALRPPRATMPMPFMHFHIFLLSRCLVPKSP